MLLSNAPGKLLLPFANAGAKNSIPVASQISITAGAASLTDGFPPLTRTPIAAGGVPPSGLDMNGILYALSAALRWANAGGGYVYDGTFAADSNVGGYPKGARVLRSDGAGYWLNTIDGNTVDPESVTVNAAQVAGWVPDLTNGVAAVTMTSANVTLTPLQYGKPIIVLSGTLTANLNLIFPNLAGEWAIINNCTGAFSVTAKTAAGSGLAIPAGGNALIYGDGTNIASLVASKGVQRFTANGTFTVPANVTTIYVSGCAGGGGGGSGGGSTVSPSNCGGGGGGGGAGQSQVRIPYSVTPGQSISITIGGAGSPGAGFTGSGATGTSGGNTVVGSLVTLTGGSGGVLGNSLTSGLSDGGAGGAGYPAGSYGTDGQANTSSANGGAGASTPFGGGGGAGRGSTGVGMSGAAAVGYGAGGGGGGGSYIPNSGIGGAGGSGAPGIVVIEW